MLRHEAFQRRHEASAQRPRQGGGGQRRPAMFPGEPRHLPSVLRLEPFPM